MCIRDSPYILGDLADYSSEKLLFTEDELLQRITCLLYTSSAKSVDFNSGGDPRGAYQLVFNIYDFMGWY